MLRESYGTVRFLLALFAVISITNLFIEPANSFDTALYLLNIVIGIGAAYLAWKLRTLVPRWHRRINALIWAVFGLNVIATGLYTLVPNARSVDASTSQMTYAFLIGLAINLAVTWYITWSIRRLALEENPTRADISKNSFLYWLIFIVVAIILTYFIFESLGTLY